MACRDGYSKSNILLGVGGKWLVEMVTLKAIFFLVSAANWPKTVSRKFVRGRVVIRDYLGLWRTDFDERPSEHVSIYGGSDGLSERSWKITIEKILPGQGSHSCM